MAKKPTKPRAAGAAEPAARKTSPRANKPAGALAPAPQAIPKDQAPAPTAKSPASKRQAAPRRTATDVAPETLPQVVPGIEPEGGPAEPADSVEEADELLAAPAALAKVAAVGGAVQRDALRSYMSQVAKHPLLSRDEENALAWRFYGDPTGNVDAAYKLVTANLRLVVKLAYQYRRAAFNVLDLIQEGNIGLMQAVRKFDPNRGIKLSSYAAWWIRAYILRYIMDNFRLVKLGTTEAQRKLFFNLRKEQEKLAAQGIEPGPKLLAERLNVSEQDVSEMQSRMGNEELSLDAPIGRADEEQRQTGMDRLQAGAQPLDDALADAELKTQFHDKLKAFGAELEGKERTIFDERMIAEQPLTLQQIGDKYGLTRERVRQLEVHLTKKLRTYMQKELPDFGELSLEKPDK